MRKIDIIKECLKEIIQECYGINKDEIIIELRKNYARDTFYSLYLSQNLYDIMKERHQNLYSIIRKKLPNIHKITVTVVD